MDNIPDPNFDGMADHYNETLDSSIWLSGEKWTYFAEHKARYIAGLLPKGFSEKILDFGCGIGNLVGFIRNHCPQASVHGFDVSGKSISKIAPETLAQGKFSSHLHELDTDYSLIVAANVLHHTKARDRQSVLGKIRDRLKIGGKLLIIEHNPLNPLTRWTVANSPIDKNVELLYSTETARHLRSADFQNIKKEYILFFPQFLSAFRLFEPCLNWLPMGAQYACVGEKIK